MLTECIEWKGATTTGYGIMKVAGANVLVHRLVYTINYGEIPDGYIVHHKCKNRRCINVEHLECMESKDHESLALGPNSKKLTHCKHGHEFTEENTYYHGDRRMCKKCVKKRSREWVRKNRKQIKLIGAIAQGGGSNVE